MLLFSSLYLNLMYGARFFQSSSLSLNLTDAPDLNSSDTTISLLTLSCPLSFSSLRLFFFLYPILTSPLDPIKQSKALKGEKQINLL